MEMRQDAWRWIFDATCFPFTSLESQDRWVDTSSRTARGPLIQKDEGVVVHLICPESPSPRQTIVGGEIAIKRLIFGLCWE